MRLGISRFVGFLLLILVIDNSSSSELQKMERMKEMIVFGAKQMVKASVVPERTYPTNQ